MADIIEVQKGVRFIRDDVTCTNSKIHVMDGEKVVNEYKNLISTGLIVSSLVLCEDGSLIFYLEE